MRGRKGIWMLTGAECRDCRWNQNCWQVGCYMRTMQHTPSTLKQVFLCWIKYLLSSVCCYWQSTTELFVANTEDDRKMRGISAARILRSYVCELCKQLRNLEPVARALFSAGIIDYEQLQQASSPHTSAAKRVQDILLELYSKVQARPEWMDTICEIFLQESVPYAVDIRGV